MRKVVVVSGAPGAGKSTLARPLAAELGFPILAKDVIKETLYDHLGHLGADPMASSRRLGAASMELLWRLASECPHVVLEANFRAQSTYEREQILALSASPVEVYCRVPASVAAARYAERGKSPEHHPVHAARSMPIEFFQEFQRPLGLGPVFEVDTAVRVDVPELARRISVLLNE